MKADDRDRACAVNEWVHVYIQRTGYFPNRVVRGGREVKYRGRAPWIAAYWQWLYARQPGRWSE